MKGPLISASMLAADQLNLIDEIQALTLAGADLLHIDVMDGHYVPNITYGPSLVKAMHRVSDLPLDVHLMIKPAMPFIEAFAAAGAASLTIHPDADDHPYRILMKIRELGVKAGVALNPGTPLSVLDALWPVIDSVLIMTVNPGFGGQAFIPECLPKIKAARQYIDQQKLPVTLAVDGGINAENAQLIRQEGADILVVGSGLFNTGDNYESAIYALKRK